MGSSATQPFMQSDMNVLRSSAFMPFDLVLHAAILFSDSFFLFDKQLLMNFLRSSPFLSAASLLHAFIRSCCAFSAASVGVATAANMPSISKARIRFKECLQNLKKEEMRNRHRPG